MIRSTPATIDNDVRGGGDDNNDKDDGGNRNRGGRAVSSSTSSSSSSSSSASKSGGSTTSGGTDSISRSSTIGSDLEDEDDGTDSDGSSDVVTAASLADSSGGGHVVGAGDDLAEEEEEDQEDGLSMTFSSSHCSSSSASRESASKWLSSSTEVDAAAAAGTGSSAATTAVPTQQPAPSLGPRPNRAVSLQRMFRCCMGKVPASVKAAAVSTTSSLSLSSYGEARQKGTQPSPLDLSLPRLGSLRRFAQSSPKQQDESSQTLRRLDHDLSDEPIQTDPYRGQIDEHRRPTPSVRKERRLSFNEGDERRRCTSSSSNRLVEGNELSVIAGSTPQPPNSAEPSPTNSTNSNSNNSSGNNMTTIAGRPPLLGRRGISAPCSAPGSSAARKASLPPLPESSQHQQELRDELLFPLNELCESELSAIGGSALPMRARLDSQLTSGSRHRRQNNSFEFSVNSLMYIHGKEDNVNSGSALRQDSNNSWATLPMQTIEIGHLQRDCSEMITDGIDDDDDDCGGDNDDGYFGDYDHVKNNQWEWNSDFDGEEGSSQVSHESPSPVSVMRILQQNPAKEDEQQVGGAGTEESVSPHDWMLQWAAASTPAAPATPASSSPERASFVRVATTGSSCESGAAPSPSTYLILPAASGDNSNDVDENCLFTAWMAASRSDCILHKTGNGNITDDDVHLIRVVKDSKGVVALQALQKGAVAWSVDLSQVSNVAVATRSTTPPKWGRAVVLVSKEDEARQALEVVDVTQKEDKVLATLLPVPLRRTKAGAVRLDAPCYKQRSQASSKDESYPSPRYEYAPDTQQDAVMHLLFCLDVSLPRDHYRP